MRSPRRRLPDQGSRHEHGYFRETHLGRARSSSAPPNRAARKEPTMPEKKTIERARNAKRQGKAPTTQAGEFVREEIHHIREGKHGARSAKQAVAIGLSKARRAGVKLGPPRKGKASGTPRKRAVASSKPGPSAGRRKPAAKRSRASTKALKKEPRASASRQALSRQARQSATARPNRTSRSRATSAARRQSRGRARRS